MVSKFCFLLAQALAFSDAHQETRLFAVVISRHGVREPVSESLDVLEFPFAAQNGDLLEEGRDQHFNLGQRLLKRYQGSLLTLDRNQNLERVFAVSSHAPRAFESALSQLRGIFGEKTRRDQVKLTQYSQQPPQSQILGGHVPEGCPRMKRKMEAYREQSPEFQQLDKFYRENLFPLLADRFGLTQDLGWVETSLIYEELAIVHLLDPDFDLKLTQEEFGLLQQFNHDHLYFYYAGDREALLLGTNELRKVLAKSLESVALKRGVQHHAGLLLMVGHDGTQSFLQKYLGIADPHSEPQFAGTTTLELVWDVAEDMPYIRLFRDFEPQKFQGLARVSLDHFAAFLREGLYDKMPCD